MIDHLASHGYHESKLTKGLFKHETQDISFTLVVDDFGIKWTKQGDLNHLITALEQKYEMKVDMESKQYVGIELKWDYSASEVDTEDCEVRCVAVYAASIPVDAICRVLCHERQKR